MEYLFRKGDRVRLNTDKWNIPLANEGLWPKKGHLGTVDSTPSRGGFTVAFDDPCPGKHGKYGWSGISYFSDSRDFDLVQEEVTVTSDTSKAMPFAVAVEKAQALNRESGNKGFYRARQRSWDKIGLYAAVDVYGPGDVNPRRRLYTLQDVGAEMTNLVAQRTPIDIIGEKSSMYWYLCFKTPQGQVLYAPDGSKWWNERQIKNVGGIVTVGTQRYRLCTRVSTRITGRAFKNDVNTDEVVPIVP